MFVMVDYERKMTVKKSCTYGEYRLFDHFLLLFKQKMNYTAYIEKSNQQNHDAILDIHNLSTDFLQIVSD